MPLSRVLDLIIDLSDLLGGKLKVPEGGRAWGPKSVLHEFLLSVPGSEVLGRAVFLSVKNPTKRSFFAPVGRKKKSGLRPAEAAIKNEKMENTAKKKKKTGRPVKAVKKDIRACVRLTKADYLVIKGKSLKAGISVAVYLRQAALQNPLRTRLSPEDRQDIRKLVGISNNINQMTKICHQEGLIQGFAYFKGFRKVVDEILAKFKS
jgi:hypothetical protein